MIESESSLPELFHWMGFCLFTIQAAESSIASAIEIALPANGVISVEGLEADEGEHRKKTIGQLVKKLNQRARIDPGVEQRLDSFVSDRNAFVHHFSERFDLNSENGRAKAIAFCQEIGSDAFGLAQLFSVVSFAIVDKLEAVTGGAVDVDWDAMPKEVSEPFRELARFLPAIIREPKGRAVGQPLHPTAHRRGQRRRPGRR
jgi:hypothetical protein